jgi:hypothetical protein
MVIGASPPRCVVAIAGEASHRLPVLRDSKAWLSSCDGGSIAGALVPQALQYTNNPMVLVASITVRGTVP